jgi:hypothetical protein
MTTVHCNYLYGISFSQSTRISIGYALSLLPTGVSGALSTSGVYVVRCVGARANSSGSGRVDATAALANRDVARSVALDTQTERVRQIDRVEAAV